MVPFRVARVISKGAQRGKVKVNPPPARTLELTQGNHFLPGMLEQQGVPAASPEGSVFLDAALKIKGDTPTLEERRASKTRTADHNSPNWQLQRLSNLFNDIICLHFLSLKMTL